MRQTFEPHLRSRLAALQPAGDGSMRRVASGLSTSTRSLQRQLKADGTSFQEVLNRTREALAKHYLAHEAMSTQEIIFLPGYDDPRSFYSSSRDETLAPGIP